jgi:tetratricopeptide (TPR) repeat protein
MIHKLFLISVFLILFLSNKGYSTGSQSDAKLQKGIEYMYNVQFDSANVIFNEMTSANPNDPAGWFFKMLVEWWKINLNKDDESNDEIFLNSVDKVIDVTDRILDKNENDYSALFYRGGAIGYRGLVRSLRESWFKAAEDGKDALNLFTKASELNTNNKDILFGIGLYNYFAEYVPQKYPFLKPLMIIFPNGDKAKGLFQITDAADNSKLAKYEARGILAYLHITYENNYFESEKNAKILVEKFPNNPVFEKYLLKSYIGLGRWIESLNGWRKVLEKADSNIVGYNNNYTRREANYYIAVTLFSMRNELEAESYLLKAEELSNKLDNSAAYLAQIYLMEGMLADKKGDRISAIYNYDRVLAMDNFSNTHHDANAFKKNPYK